jgi:hypothetical protein
VGKESTFGKEMDRQSTISPIFLLASRYLVGGLEHFLFFHILGIITPTDELIFLRGVGQPPTRYD